MFDKSMQRAGMPRYDYAAIARQARSARAQYLGTLMAMVFNRLMRRRSLAQSARHKRQRGVQRVVGQNG